MNRCEEHRKHLESWNAFNNLVFPIFIGSEGTPCDYEGHYQNSLLHVQNCEECFSWLKNKVPINELNRHERLLQYCCPVMFGAVEEPQVNQLKISLRDFQGYPTWVVKNFNVIGGNLLIGYCPWCGVKMPQKPFINSDGQ